jgi:hypothetical protein
VNADEAKVIRRIFEWAAEGVGLTTIVERLNAEGVPGTGGKRWSKHPVTRILKNERYLGRQIWGQQSVEHEPGTGRRIMRDNPRSEWRVEDRPELRIVPDELWAKVQRTRAENSRSGSPEAEPGTREEREIPFATLVDWVCQMPSVWRCHDQCFGREGQPSNRVQSLVEPGT